jgi:hypothetical protein
MDYTGMSPEAIHEVGLIIGNTNWMGFIMFAAVLIFFMTIFAIICEVRNSKKYRKFKTDMYVSAKIGQYAEKDGLSLEEEELKYKMWCKRDRRTYMELDQVVEDDLSERIAEDKMNLDNKITKKQSAQDLVDRT